MQYNLWDVRWISCYLQPQIGMNEIFFVVIKAVKKYDSHSPSTHVQLFISDLRLAQSNVSMFQDNWKLLNMPWLTINRKEVALEGNQEKCKTYFLKRKKSNIRCMSSRVWLTRIKQSKGQMCQAALFAFVQFRVTQNLHEASSFTHSLPGHSCKWANYGLATLQAAHS